MKAQQRTATSLKSGLGAAIRRARFILRISQGELGLRAELCRAHISDLERGARNPSVESIEKLAAALQISVAKLFEQAGAGKT